MLGDSCERLAEIPDDSMDLSVCSPPFASLYTYSPSLRDLGNCSTRGEFLEHYGFIIREQLRVTKPGRNACVHVQQVTTTKAVDGYIGLTDFRGEVIRAFQDAGWIFYGEVTIWKNPQAQAIRTKAHALMFQSKNRDSAGIRPALADYLLIFKKPGDNAVPIPHEVATGEVTNDDWIEWASPIWYDAQRPRPMTRRGAPEPGVDDDPGDEHAQRAGGPRGRRRAAPVPAAAGLHRAVRPAVVQPGRDGADPVRRHRVRGLRRLKLGRRGIGIELKASYWRTAVDNLRRLDADMKQDTLFG